MTKRVSKIALYSTLSILVTVGGLALFTQTPMFRETLRSSLYKILESEVNADIYIGEINGSILTGLTIDTVMMYVDGAPFVESGTLSIKYNLLDILNDKITVDSLTIENPSVHLIRWKNGEWNVNRLSKSTSPDDTTESPLVVNAGKLRILNAQFYLTDSTGAFDSVMIDRNGRRSINYSDIRLEQVNIDIDGMYSSSALIANINHLSFVAPREKFTLLKLRSQVSRTKDSSTVKNLAITTPSSKIELTARLRGIDVFEISTVEELRNAEVSLHVVPSNILTNDIQAFLPSLDFFKGSVYFDGTMDGDFENLSVRSLSATFGASTISVSGTVSNIYHPKELRLNIVSRNCTINPSDIPAIMPYFGIPDYSNLGLTTFEFQFVGKPLDFLAISKMKSAAGTVTVDGQMVITEENIHYKGIFAGNNVNLEKVFSSNEFLSRLNTRMFIEGEGTSLATLNSEATVEIDSSMFRNIAIQTSKVHIAAKNQKIETEISLQTPEGNVNAQVFADFSIDSLPLYMVTASVRGLDLAPIVQDEYFSSDLSFDLQRSGAGLTLFNNPSDMKLDFYSSNFHGMPFDSAQVVMQWLKDSANNDHVTVRSPVVDGTLRGQFTFNSLIDAVRAHLDGFGKIYTYQQQIVDSSYAALSDSTGQRDSITMQSGSITYDLVLKNLKPISVVFNFPQLDMIGTAKGTLNGNASGASSTGNVSILHGSFADSTAPIQLTNVQLEYSVRNMSPEQIAGVNDSLELKIRLKGDEIGISQTAFRQALFNLDYAKQHGVFTIASDVDTMLNFAADGIIDVSELTDKITFSNLYAKYQGLDLRSSTPFVTTVSSKGIHIDSSRFIRHDEEIFVRGDYNYQGAIKANATVKNFDLSDIFFVNTSQRFREQALDLGGKIDLSAKITGTAENPVIIAQMEGVDISYRNSSFGDLTAALGYARKKAGIKLELTESEEAAVPQTFNLEGSIPIDLSFLPAVDRLNIDGIDVQLSTENLSVSIFDVFVPELDQMSGRLSGNVGITGSLLDPRQYGTLQLDSGSFRLEMNDIQYQVGGTIALDSGKIFFPNFAINNLPGDYADGIVKIGGYILLDGFAPSEYHLTANGELLVLNNLSRSSNQSFFGSLVGQTGPKGLRFEGTFDRSRIVGDIIVQDAFLTFPPTQQAVSPAGARFDDILFIDDTTKLVVDSTLLHTIVQLIAPIVGSKTAERTFLDGFGYELTIETRGNVRVQMIFNANAGAYEELVAELNGKMVLKKDETAQQLTGTINVGDGSNYKYYKEFKATGSLTFVGDPQNPQLNILAKYIGTHLRDPKDNTSEERVVVSLEITGNRNNPKLKIGLAMLDANGREIPRQGDVENDAIAFLLTSSQNKPGQFREELSNYDRNRLGEQLTEAIGGTFVNSLLSGLVNDFITKNNIPFVKRVEVRNVTSEADINTILEVSDAVINIGGKVFTDVNNTNVSVQVPVLGRQNRNFIFEVEKKTENADYTSIQAKTILGARLFYRFTF
ncbi:MAG: hypothetical protein WCX28_00990 [Bacteriovoracaceae bacterium]